MAKEFKFSCPNCGQHLSAEDNMAGLEAECPTCTTTLVIPKPEQAGLEDLQVPVDRIASDIAEDVLTDSSRTDRLPSGRAPRGFENLSAPPTVAGPRRRLSSRTKWTLVGVAGVIVVFSFVGGIQYWVIKQVFAGARPNPPVPSSRSPQASTSRRHQSTARDRTARRTKELWDEMRRIQNNLQTADSEPLASFQTATTGLAQLNVDYADPALVSHIRGYINIFGRFLHTAREYTNARNRLTGDVDAAAQLGAALGSTDSRDPRGSALGGALLFGMLGAGFAEVEAQEIDAKYEPVIQGLRSEMVSLGTRQYELARMLSGRYNLPFN